MQNLDVSKTVDAWSSLADTVFVPHSEAEYQRLVTSLDGLIDEVGESEAHPLASLTMRNNCVPHIFIVNVSEWLGRSQVDSVVLESAFALGAPL